MIAKRFRRDWSGRPKRKDWEMLPGIAGKRNDSIIATKILYNKMHDGNCLLIAIAAIF
jgi:hypothetical protein